MATETVSSSIGSRLAASPQGARKSTLGRPRTQGWTSSWPWDIDHAESFSTRYCPVLNGSAIGPWSDRRNFAPTEASWRECWWRQSAIWHGVTGRGVVASGKREKPARWWLATWRLKEVSILPSHGARSRRKQEHTSCRQPIGSRTRTRGSTSLTVRLGCMWAPSLEYLSLQVRRGQD